MVSGTGVTVGTVIKESLHKTLAFVAWYLDLGAERVVLYCDDPEDPVLSHVADEPRVAVIRCTPEFWQGLGLDPGVRFTKRQNAALTHGYRAATTAWYLAVDGDEFVHLGGRTLGEFADTVDAQARSVRFCTAEAVGQVEQDAYFRIPAGSDVLRSVYGGGAAWLLRTRGGLMGHGMGKSMTRTGLEVSKLRQHFAVDMAGEPIDDLAVGPTGEAVLLHYFATSFENWRDKMMWRRQSWGFSRRVAEQIDRVQGDEDEAKQRDLYDRLHVLSAKQLQSLHAQGGALVLAVDPQASARRRYPDLFASSES